MSQALVLSVGADPLILATRNLLLQSAGYFVVSAGSMQEAAHLFRDGDFDLLLLCHTLPQTDGAYLNSFIRALGSHIPIVCVSGTAPSEHSAFVAAISDEYPAAFIAALEEVLSRQAGIPAAVPVPRNDGRVSSARKPTAIERAGQHVSSHLILFRPLK